MNGDANLWSWMMLQFFFMNTQNPRSKLKKIGKTQLVQKLKERGQLSKLKC
jgi:hypothetical protein